VFRIAPYYPRITSLVSYNDHRIIHHGKR